MSIRNDWGEQMKARIVFTDKDGSSWEHELSLVPTAENLEVGAVRGARKRKARGSPQSMNSEAAASLAPDFALPIRPFIKRYASGASGPRKFAILVARLAGGDLRAEIPLTDIERQWNKMTQLMGGRLNPAHASRARDKAWVDSPKHGVYKLLSGWQTALASK